MKNRIYTFHFGTFLFMAMLLCTVSLYAQTPTKNYIFVQEPVDPVTTIDTNTDAIRSVQYFDGLGRPEQTVSIKATPDGKDIVTKTEYDGFGRQAKDYLPVPVSQSNGNFINPANITGNYYQTNYTQSVWYSEKTFENSPLNRVLKQAAPGDVWAKDTGHEIKFEYKTNTTADQVSVYWLNSSGEIQKGNYNNDPNYNFYEAGTLYKTITTDENGHKIYEFKDKQGRVILKRSFVTEYTLSERPGPNPPTGTYKKANTYYVYDIYGNLAAVIPPLASEKPTITSDIQKNLCYIYKYDDRNRLIEKKLPGKEWEYMVYDKQDRLVATQDANMRKTQPYKWLFTKYDKFGRVVYTGIFTSSATRATLQTSVNSFGSNNEERKATVQFTQNGLQVYYTRQAFPNTFTDVLTVNYYDKYVNLSVYGFQEPESAYDPNPRKETNGKLKGMPTETHIRILGTSQWEKSVTFYDQKSRPIRSYKLNHLGGYTDTDSDLNFRGLPLETTTKHFRNANAIEVKVKDVFAYDHQERLLTHNQKINNGTNNLIAANTYDKLGQLITKKVGGAQNGSDRWQEVDYKYNIRGWLTDINDVGLVLYGKDAEPPTMGDDLFAFKINYDLLNDGGSQYADPLYNGNIAQTIWRTGDDNVKRGYVYNYDELNRLLEAQFYKSDNNPYTGAYTENLAYDLNGNITSLFRTTGDVYGESVGMDDLAYSYQDGNGNSNLLLNVSDAVSNQNTGGFKDGNTNPALDDYEYDANGNMVKDRNKGISFITYNHLNLPEQIVFENSNSIEYTYNAAGVKLKKTVIEETATPVVRIEVDYLDGFQYAGEVLNFFPTAEGYVRATPVGNITPGAPPTGYAYSYVFNYTDHLGNVRLSYSMDHLTGKLKILEENHYYPFGLRHGVYDTGGRKDFSRNPGDGIEPEPGLPPVLDYVTRMEYQYKYNGKEWQDELGLNFYDYGARNYDPAIGRWMNMDPLAEMYPDISPYAYAANTPTMFVDYDGRHFGVEIDHEKKKITITGHFFANKEDMKLLNEIASYLNEQTGVVLKVGKGEDAEAYSIGFKITTEESSNPAESARDANLNDKDGNMNNFFVQDSNDPFLNDNTLRGAANQTKAAIRDGEGVFAGIHEALHLLGSGHKDGIMRGSSTSGGMTPGIYGAILRGVGIGNRSIGSGKRSAIGRGHIRNETGERPAGFTSGTIMNRATFDRQMQRAVDKRERQERKEQRRNN